MANFPTFSTCNRNPGPPRSSSPGGIQTVRSFPDLDSLVLGLLAQQCECPVYCLLKCVRLDVLVSLDPGPARSGNSSGKRARRTSLGNLEMCKVRSRSHGPKGSTTDQSLWISGITGLRLANQIRTRT